MDSVTELRLLKNFLAHRVPGGVCADVIHCRSGIWECISCRDFVPEMERLAYFKEQAADWESKAEKFRSDRQLADNFAAIAAGFKIVVEKQHLLFYRNKNIQINTEKTIIDVD